MKKFTIISAAMFLALAAISCRKEGFEDIVMSDWVSTYSTIGCAFSGLDLEMPLAYAMKPEYLIQLGTSSLDIRQEAEIQK